MIEVLTKVNYKDPSANKRKSLEIAYATVIKVKDKGLDKKELKK